MTKNKNKMYFKRISYLYELAIFVRIQLCGQKHWNFTIIYVIWTVKQDGRIPGKTTFYRTVFHHRIFITCARMFVQENILFSSSIKESKMVFLYGLPRYFLEPSGFL